MPGAVYLCTTDDECPRHGKYIYFCKECHDEWAEQNPHTVEALRKPGVSRSTLSAARKKDIAWRAEQSTAVQNPGDEVRD